MLELWKAVQLRHARGTVIALRFMKRVSRAFRSTISFPPPRSEVSTIRLLMSVPHLKSF